ncbi:LPXTG cell wall anchor domain-containing protein, partial [Enterococcus casseliflavus]
PETQWQAVETGKTTYTETVYNQPTQWTAVETFEPSIIAEVSDPIFELTPITGTETFTADVSNRTFEQTPIETGKTVYTETIETPETQWQAVETGKTTYTETVYNQPTQWTAVETFEPSIIAEVSDPIFELTPITRSETVITDVQDPEQDLTAYDDITKPTHIEGSKVKVIAEVDQKDPAQKDSTKSDKHDITKATADTDETKTIALIAGKSSTYDQPANKIQADQNGAESKTDTDKMITEIAGVSNIVALPKTGETDSLLSSALSAIGLTLVAGAGVLFFKPRKPIGKHSKR